MYQIEKNIPIPPKASGRPSGRQNEPLPIFQMQVGDSILVADKSQNNICALVSHYTKNMVKPFKFETRRVEGGVRVWRVQ